MPKASTPKAPSQAPVTPEAPKPVDISPLITSLSAHLSTYKEAGETQTNARIDIAVEARSFRDEAGEGFDRAQMRTAIQTAIAETYGLKLDHVQNKPEEKLKNSKPEDYATRNSCYTLVSELLSIAWAKEEKQDAKVAKLLEAGERKWAVLKKAAQKPQNNSGAQTDNKITRENFAAKFNLWLTGAQTDMACSVEEAVELVEKSIENMKAAPQA